MTALCLCGQPVTDAFLCSGCTNALAVNLQSIPDLLDELDATARRQSVMPVSAIGDPACMHDGDCGCGVWLPWNERASRCADELRNAVTSWTRALCDDLGVVIPLAAVTRGAEWLASVIRAIRQRPWAGDCAEDIRGLIERGWLAVDRSEERFYAGPCGAVTEGGACTYRLWARSEDTMVKCRQCGTIYSVLERQERLYAAAADITQTATELASTITLIRRERFSASTVRTWAFRGELPRVNHDPDVAAYRLGDVLALIKRAETKRQPA